MFSLKTTSRSDSAGDGVDRVHQQPKSFTALPGLTFHLVFAIPLGKWFSNFFGHGPFKPLTPCNCFTCLFNLVIEPLTLILRTIALG